jgi:hypothetical protein
MRKQWRCFFCDEVFTRAVDAAEHFGAHQDDTPACCLHNHEHHLVHYIRRLEGELARYRAEDSDVMRSICAMEADHRRALIRAEEEGYNRGVRDMADQTRPRNYCVGE